MLLVCMGRGGGSMSVCGWTDNVCGDVDVGGCVRKKKKKKQHKGNIGGKDRENDDKK